MKFWGASLLCGLAMIATGHAQEEILGDGSAIVQALEDYATRPEVSLRQKAAYLSAEWIIGLQRRAIEGVQPSAAQSDSVRQILSFADGLVTDSDNTVRRQGARIMIFGNPATEPASHQLLAVFDREAAPKNRSALLTDMAFAGHRSKAFAELLQRSLKDPEVRVRESAAQALAIVRPEEALTALEAALDDPEIIRDFVVEAIGAYGAAACPLLPRLRRMIPEARSEGSLIDALTESIARIENPAPPSIPATTVRSLIPTPLSPAASPTLPPVSTPATVPQPSASPAPLESAKSEASAAENPTNSILIAFALLILAGYLIRILTRSRSKRPPP